MHPAKKRLLNFIFYYFSRHKPKKHGAQFCETTEVAVDDIL